MLKDNPPQTLSTRRNVWKILPRPIRIKRKLAFELHKRPIQSWASDPVISIATTPTKQEQCQTIARYRGKKNSNFTPNNLLPSVGAQIRRSRPNQAPGSRLLLVQIHPFLVPQQPMHRRDGRPRRRPRDQAPEAAGQPELHCRDGHQRRQNRRVAHVPAANNDGVLAEEVEDEPEEGGGGEEEEGEGGVGQEDGEEGCGCGEGRVVEAEVAGVASEAELGRGEGGRRREAEAGGGDGEELRWGSEGGEGGVEVLDRPGYGVRAGDRDGCVSAAAAAAGGGGGGGEGGHFGNCLVFFFWER